MDIATSIKTCFKKYADIKGRASRSEFFYFGFSFVLIYFGIVLFRDYLDGSNLYYELSDSLYSAIDYLAIGLSYGLPAICLIPFLSAAIRRIHDIGHSAGIIVIFLIGLIVCIIYQMPQLIFVVFFSYLSQKSDKKNKFGPPPKK